ncbi:MAG: FAD-binding protein [Pseudomonadota bacterium]
MPEPLIVFESNVRFVNWHRNVQVEVARLYDAWNRWSDRSRPTTRRWEPGLRALSRIVQHAEADGKRVRALGGAWSLSEAAVTRDYMVNTKPLNYVDVGLKPENVDPAYAGNPEYLVFTQCGTSVLELNRILERRGLALPTSGASNGQTFCGAFSTGTHGAANMVGSMQDYVAGLHVVGEGGRDYWVEPASRPVVSRKFCETLGTELRRDDRLFNALLVSFGSFGLIHAALFMAVPIYLLERHVRPYSYDRVRPSLSTLDVSGLDLPDGRGLPFHYEVVLNPYARRDRQGAYVRFMYQRPYSALPAAPTTTDTRVIMRPSDDVLSVIGAIGDVAPALLPYAVEELLEREFEPQDGELGTPAQAFGSTTLRGSVVSTELGVPLLHAENAVEAVLAVANDFPFAGLAAVRYVRASAALLAFTHHEPFTCTIELPAAGSQRALEAYDRIWNELERRNVPYTLHWGQILKNDPAHFRRAYGTRLDAWLAARRAFLTPAGRRTFSNDLLERAGLAS